MHGLGRLTTTRCVSVACAAVTLACVAPIRLQANPEVKDYEISRFLMLKTSCVTLHLKRVNPGERPIRFHAECKNTSNWPDGIDIECSEHDDDRSCRGTTKERNFKHLELLRQPN